MAFFPSARNWRHILCIVPVNVSSGEIILAATSTGLMLQDEHTALSETFLTFLSYIFALYSLSQYSYPWKKILQPISTSI